VQVSTPQDGAVAELHLADNAKFFPTNAALAGWRVQAHQGKAAIVYE
jgi:DNA polymerase-3 subunit alpha